MSRDPVVTDAAVYGVLGLVLLVVGTLVAVSLVDTLDLWVALVLGVLVWTGCAFYGMKQFAHGVHLLVEDASSD